MKTLYDAAGKAHEVEPVDAREWLATGSYFAEPPASEPEPPEPPEPPKRGPGRPPKVQE